MISEATVKRHINNRHKQQTEGYDNTGAIREKKR
jgi:hypothetical protein